MTSFPQTQQKAIQDEDLALSPISVLRCGGCCRFSEHPEEKDLEFSSTPKMTTSNLTPACLWNRMADEEMTASSRPNPAYTANCGGCRSPHR